MITPAQTKPVTPSKLIFACSGGADVGAISDQAARKLTRDGAGKMYCLAGIGGRVPPIMETTRNAAVLLAIDGCPQNCARKALEHAGFTRFLHLELSRDLGFVKGQTEPTPDHIRLVADRALEILTR
jgi:uncharacterized metal-binding protein